MVALAVTIPRDWRTPMLLRAETIGSVTLLTMMDNKLDASNHDGDSAWRRKTFSAGKRLFQHRALACDSQKLFRQTLAAGGPEPCAGASGHNDCKHKPSRQ